MGVIVKTGCTQCKRDVGSEGARIWDPSGKPPMYLFFCSRDCAEGYAKSVGAELIEALVRRQDIEPEEI